MNKAYSVGIIGGADGPTAVFIAGRFPWEIFLVCVILIVLIICFVIKKKK